MRGRTVAVVVGLAVLAGGCGEEGPGAARSDVDFADVGPPSQIEVEAPSAVRERGRAAVDRFEAGRSVMAQSGCLACHEIGPNGNRGPGPVLTRIGARLDAGRIAATLVKPTAPMPSFAGLQDSSPQKFRDLVAFLAALR